MQQRVNEAFTAAGFKELEGRLVPAIEAAAGPSPEWYQPEA